MTDRKMSDAEADVIQAAWDLEQDEEGGKYGPNREQIRRSKRALTLAVDRLAAEWEGQWQHPDMDLKIEFPTDSTARLINDDPKQ